ncbi:MAG: energy-coupling factor transporter ATPase [Candidatus Onthovivens sp.]|nr:energy-coupling factor transporter ATPase [Candidatus Onthovivens sp.]
MEYAIEAKNISYSYDGKVDVIKDISFKIPIGSYVTLIGHNGSGKSTLAKLICYLIEPSKGFIYYNGKEMNEENITDIRKNIGIVFQNPDNQFIGSSVEDDIAFGLENRNIELKKMRELVHTFAKKVGMEKFLDKEPTELSGGQKQRVAIAGILALNLKIIIFDEATSMLDPEGVSEIKNLIFEMKEADPNLTFISITHDIEEAYLSDFCIILKNGTIYKEGKPEDIFANEQDILDVDLDIPFVLKIKNALARENIEIPSSIKTIESLSEYLCKLK